MPTAFPYPSGTVGSDANIMQQSHTFRDSKGFTGTIRYFVNPNGAALADILTGVAALLVAFKALTNAAYQGSRGILNEFGVKQYGAQGVDYASCRMKARMVFQDESGGLHAISIPAPKIACFDTDRQTILPSGVASVTSVIAAPGGPVGSGADFVCSRDGIQLVNFMGGFFVARQRRANKLFVLSAPETAGEPGD